MNYQKDFNELFTQLTIENKRLILELLRIYLNIQQGVSGNKKPQEDSSIFDSQS